MLLAPTLTSFILYYEPWHISNPDIHNACIFRTLELIVPKFDGIYIHVKNIKMFFGNSSMLKLVFAKRSLLDHFRWLPEFSLYL